MSFGFAATPKNGITAARENIARKPLIIIPAARMMKRLFSRLVKKNDKMLFIFDKKSNPSKLL